MKIDRDELYGLGLDELVDEICELKQQLQAYKDKEEKLREKIDHEMNILAIIGGNHTTDNINIQYTVYQELLQILNEGGDK